MNGKSGIVAKLKKIDKISDVEDKATIAVD